MKVRDEVEHLLDDDGDMAEMYLTNKLLRNQLEGSFASESFNTCFSTSPVRPGPSEDEEEDDFSTTVDEPSTMAYPEVTLKDTMKFHHDMPKSGFMSRPPDGLKYPLQQPPNLSVILIMYKVTSVQLKINGPLISPPTVLIVQTTIDNV